MPLSAPDSEGERRVEDDNRIVEALPTIKYAIEKGAQGNGSPNAAAVLAERISRLEVGNASLTEDNKRLRQVAKERERQNDHNGDGNLESGADVSKC